MKNFKRLFSVLVFSLVALLPINAYAFEDVKDHWAEKDINWADSANLVAGYPDKTFKPEGKINNVEFYVIINKVGEFEDTKDVSFKDVVSNEWYVNDVKKAVGAGYINDGEELKPLDAITRDEVARIVSTVYKLDGAESEVEKFKDKDEIDNKGAVGALVKAGVLVGDPSGDFRPDSPITRAEAVRIFHKVYEVYGKADIYLGKYDNDLIILHTNDVHGNVSADDSHIGYANYKNVIDALKKRNNKVLVIDAGDASQGSNFASLNEGADVIKVMNLLGINAFTPGNHEFDYSKESALENNKNSKFTWYASNIIDEATKKPVFSEGQIVDVDGLKVGVFGLATPETKYKADPRNTVGLAFANTLDENVKIAKGEVESLKSKGAEVIVMISHLGDDKSSEIKSIDIADKVDGIDVIVDGHSHTLHERGKAHGKSFIVSTGDTLKNIGFTTISKDKNVKSRMITKGEAVVYGENEKVKGEIDSLLAEQDKVLAVVLGKSATNLDGERSDVRTKETNLGNLITDAMKKASGADVVITNGGGIRASIKARRCNCRRCIYSTTFWKCNDSNRSNWTGYCRRIKPWS